MDDRNPDQNRRALALKFGLVLLVLRLTGSKPLTLAGSSLLFTASHPYSLRELAFIFSFGLVLGLFSWKGRSLPRLILARTAFNLAIADGLP